MGDYMARVILHTADAIPANYVQNQFGITTGSDDPDFDGITAALKGFYDDINSAVFSTAIAQNGHEVKYYVMPGIMPNYPVEEQTWNLASGTAGVAYPREVAIALSFQGQRAAGFPQARRRGRVFLGPVNSATNSDGRPNSSTRNVIAGAAEDLGAAIQALTGHQWSVWSTVDAEMVPILDGWVDNAYDTQRRRGVETTERTTWSVP